MCSKTLQTFLLFQCLRFPLCHNFQTTLTVIRNKVGSYIGSKMLCLLKYQAGKNWTQQNAILACLFPVKATNLEFTFYHEWHCIYFVKWLIESRNTCNFIAKRNWKLLFLTYSFPFPLATHCSTLPGFKSHQPRGPN